jgi:hypothetical protein
MSGKLIGMLPRNFAVVILENHAWYEHAETIDGKNIAEFFKNHLLQIMKDNRSQKMSKVLQ